jgi:hypothetical protein
VIESQIKIARQLKSTDPVQAIELYKDAIPKISSSMLKAVLPPLGVVSGIRPTAITAPREERADS